LEKKKIDPSVSGNTHKYKYNTGTWTYISYD